MTEVISKKGNVYKVKKIHSDKEFFLVTNGKTHAHGETLKSAKEDFRFKIVSEKLKSDCCASSPIQNNPLRFAAGFFYLSFNLSIAKDSQMQ